MAKKAVITGINGQDGSYLAELLLGKGYEVFGIIRREAQQAPEVRLRNLTSILDKITLHGLSLDNSHSVSKLVEKVQPDEFYHLAAPSFVNSGFDNGASDFLYNFNSLNNILLALKESARSCRLYYAGSSEMFGEAQTMPQNEGTVFRPRTMYGISKVACYHLLDNFRKYYGLFACMGKTYNHESIRRGYEFVTRKISVGVAKIHLGLADTLELGSLDARRDWGYAPEYVQAMWQMLQQDKPDDYVIASGNLLSVREITESAFKTVSLNYEKYVISNEKYVRPEPAVQLVGDPSKARRILGWSSEKKITQILEEMVLHDIQLLSK